MATAIFKGGEIQEYLADVVTSEDHNQIIACGFGYSRIMSQGKVSFNAGIIGCIAVNRGYRGLGLCKKMMQKLDSYMVSSGAICSFLFAYEPKVYLSSGYVNLLAPIHYFDKQLQVWNTFIYRGGMVKLNGLKQLSDTQAIEFKGCIY
ncbi:GNAT family N-acetyltransferase [Agarivorans sp. B2Z047]|uniref:GNAT family N-acetyltransferase n=1 Tax=Agarivorans sp. B2Z047 TaxID=2652721 RepID=UPI00128DE931|nr:GNAT family N-acetyltransferase [Agarivorans sp. B2Z047]MPW29305.1 GNAT family N-acetyltransferase [Agarivorans sp. B2Z047]UQN44892.1 GNAT family N-acetyltransferase [Agarivorans sp. B2Z047]